MNREEKEEIRNMPEKYKPIGAWGYVGYSILYSIPVIGWLFLLVFAISGGNVARRSFARSYFAKFLIVLIIGVVIILVFGSTLKELYLQYKDQIMQMIEQMKGGMQ